MASAVESFQRCGERAAQRGVTFCLEPLTTLETDFITTATEAAEMVRRGGHPGFQMMVDVRAMSYEGQPIPDIIRQVAPTIRHVHLNDSNRLGPGMGEVDWEPILCALREVGYEGWLSDTAKLTAEGAESAERKSLGKTLRSPRLCGELLFYDLKGSKDHGDSRRAYRRIGLA